MTKSTDIINRTAYRESLRASHEQARETGRPLFVTDHGRTEAVVLSAEAYDELLDQAQLPEILEAIGRAETEFAAGRGIDALQGIKRIAEKHGLALDR